MRVDIVRVDILRVDSVRVDILRVDIPSVDILRVDMRVDILIYYETNSGGVYLECFQLLVQKVHLLGHRIKLGSSHLCFR